MIFRIARVASSAVLLLSIASCKPSDQPGTDSGPAELGVDASATAAAVPARQTEAADAVAALKALAPTGTYAKANQVAAYLDRYFEGQCIDGDPRLSFDRVCQHYAADAAKDDPSPWPDLVLGIEDGRIVSAVLASDEETLGAGWGCAPAAGFDAMRFCYVETAPDADRIRWSAEWTAYFGSGD